MFTAAWAIILALACAAITVLAWMGVRAWQRSRITPEERERQRRFMLVSGGKMGDADLVDFGEGSLVYSYDVRGVEYTASQDVSRLQALLPGDMASLGVVQVKYDPRNPANSIVLAEDWSGLHPASARPPGE